MMDHLDVHFVPKRIHTIPTWKFTFWSTLEKNLIFANFVAKVSIKVVAWTDTLEQFTWRKIFIDLKIKWHESFLIQLCKIPYLQITDLSFEIGRWKIWMSILWQNIYETLQHEVSYFDSYWRKTISMQQLWKGFQSEK